MVGNTHNEIATVWETDDDFQAEEMVYSHQHIDEDEKVFDCYQNEMPVPNQEKAPQDATGYNVRRLNGFVEANAIKKKEVDETIMNVEEPIHYQDEIRKRQIADMSHATILTQSHVQESPLMDKKSVGFVGYNNVMSYKALYGTPADTNRGTLNTTRKLHSSVSDVKLMNEQELELIQPHRKYEFKSVRPQLTSSDYKNATPQTFEMFSILNKKEYEQLKRVGGETDITNISLSKSDGVATANLHVAVAKNVSAPITSRGSKSNNGLNLRTDGYRSNYANIDNAKSASRHMIRNERLTKNMQVPNQILSNVGNVSNFFNDTIRQQLHVPLQMQALKVNNQHIISALPNSVQNMTTNRQEINAPFSNNIHPVSLNNDSDGAQVLTQLVTTNRQAVNGSVANNVATTGITGTATSIQAMTTNRQAVNGSVANNAATTGTTGTATSIQAMTTNRQAVNGSVANNAATTGTTGTATSIQAMTTNRQAVNGSVANNAAATGTTGTATSIQAMTTNRQAVNGSIANNVATTGITSRAASTQAMTTNRQTVNTLMASKAPTLIVASNIIGINEIYPSAYTTNRQVVNMAFVNGNSTMSANGIESEGLRPSIGTNSKSMNTNRQSINLAAASNILTPGELYVSSTQNISQKTTTNRQNVNPTLRPISLLPSDIQAATLGHASTNTHSRSKPLSNSSNTAYINVINNQNVVPIDIKSRRQILRATEIPLLTSVTYDDTLLERKHQTYTTKKTREIFKPISSIRDDHLAVANVNVHIENINSSISKVPLNVSSANISTMETHINQFNNPRGVSYTRNQKEVLQPACNAPLLTQNINAIYKSAHQFPNVDISKHTSNKQAINTTPHTQISQHTNVYEQIHNNGQTKRKQATDTSKLHFVPVIHNNNHNIDANRTTFELHKHDSSRYSNGNQRVNILEHNTTIIPVNDEAFQMKNKVTNLSKKHHISNVMMAESIGDDRNKLDAVELRFTTNRHTSGQNSSQSASTGGQLMPHNMHDRVSKHNSITLRRDSELLATHHIPGSVLYKSNVNLQNIRNSATGDSIAPMSGTQLTEFFPNFNGDQGGLERTSEQTDSRMKEISSETIRVARSKREANTEFIDQSPFAAWSLLEKDATDDENNVTDVVNEVMLSRAMSKSRNFVDAVLTPKPYELSR